MATAKFGHPETVETLRQDIAGLERRGAQLQNELARVTRERDAAVNALRELFDSYKLGADSGDWGNWCLEDQPEAQAALSVLGIKVES